MNKQILTETLAETRFLEGISKSHLECLAEIARLEEFEDGDVLFSEGEPVDCVYLVICGEIALEVSASGIPPQQVFMVGAGESLGWSALMDSGRRTATARATALTSVARIDGEQLLAICEDHPRFGYEIMRRTVTALARRLQSMRARFLEVYRLQPNGFTWRTEEIGVD